MGEVEVLLHLIDELKNQVEIARSDPGSYPLAKAITSLRKCLEQFTTHPSETAPPHSRAEIRNKLLTDPIALKIRETWTENRRLIDLKALARDAGVTVKNPTLDHVVAAYYQRRGLPALSGKLEAIAKADGSRAKREMFQQWRGELRTLTSKENIADEIRLKIARQGLPTVRSFAEHLGTRDPNNRKKLAKNATEQRLVDAVTAHLWKEKMDSRAQEGR
ncbi:MAG: hypothetical protein AB1646_06445 [Thermodesulfobacteriota bacterium]